MLQGTGIWKISKDNNMEMKHLSKNERISEKKYGFIAKINSIKYNKLHIKHKDVL